MKTLAILVVSWASPGCAEAPPTAGSSDPSPTVSACDEERDPELERVCPDAFSADEEAELLARLSDLSDLDEVAFVNRDDVVLPSSAVRHDGVVIRGTDHRRR